MVAGSAAGHWCGEATSKAGAACEGDVTGARGTERLASCQHGAPTRLANAARVIVHGPRSLTHSFVRGRHVMGDASAKTAFVVSQSGGSAWEICLVVCTPAVSARRTLRAQHALGSTVLDLGALALPAVPLRWLCACCTASPAQPSASSCHDHLHPLKTRVGLTLCVPANGRNSFERALLKNFRALRAPGG